MRKFLLTGLVVLSASLSPAASAQLISGHSDPQGGTFSVRTPDGTLVVADAISQKVYISAINGASSEITFQQAIETAEPDPSKRQAMLAAITSGFTSSTSAGAFAFPVEGPQPNPCPNNGSNPGGWEEECEFGVMGTFLNSMMSGDGDPLPKPTDLDGITVTGMRPEILTGAGVFYFSDNAGNYNNPGGSVSYQRYYADDYNRWKKNRSAACEAAHIQSFVVAGMVAGSVGACGAAAASGGLAAFACGGMIVGTMASFAQMHTLSQVCASEYPGPGNW